MKSWLDIRVDALTAAVFGLIAKYETGWRQSVVVLLGCYFISSAIIGWWMKSKQEKEGVNGLPHKTQEVTGGTTMTRYEVRFLFSLLFLIASRVDDRMFGPMMIASGGFFLIGMVELWRSR